MDAWQLVFQTSLPLMAAAYLLYPYGGIFAVVSPGLHTLGFQYFFVTFWSILGSKQLRHDVPAACSVAVGLFAVNAGQAVGLGLWNLLCVGIDATGLHIAVSVAVFALVVAAVTFEHPAFGWGTVRPGEAPKSGSGNRDLPYEALIERIRTDYGLSPREHDVCLLLGRGRNRQFVADELGISLETAKTHATNVYRKLGVHSQQELLDADRDDPGHAGARAWEPVGYPPWSAPHPPSIVNRLTIPHHPADSLSRGHDRTSAARHDSSRCKAREHRPRGASRFTGTPPQQAGARRPKETPMNATASITRKNFLLGAGLAGLAAAVAAPKGALAAEDVAWDEECDVLVIGSGYSGLAAAYEAKAAGADVKIIEKLDIPGGNSMVADGDFAVCMSEGQKALGIEDSVEHFVHDMQVAGLFLNDVEKCSVIAEKSNETWEWTRDVLGVEWQTNDDGVVTPIAYGGHSILRTLHPVVGHGSAMVLPLIQKLSEMGLEIECGRMLVNLVKDESGRVVGAEDPRRRQEQRPHHRRARVREGQPRRRAGQRRLWPRRRVAHAARPAPRRLRRLHQRRRRHRREPLHRDRLRRAARAPRLDPVRALVQPRRGGLRREPHLNRLGRPLRPEHQPPHRRALRERAHRPQALLRRNL